MYPRRIHLYLIKAQIFLLVVPFTGQTEIVNMLLTKCKGINIDAKNNLGFTPLMKAALQGRTKTAKLLLFAGKYTLYFRHFPRESFQN